MGSMFHSPDSIKAPKPIAPAALPEEETDQKKPRKRVAKGRQETFLTGELVPDTGKKAVLG